MLSSLAKTRFLKIKVHTLIPLSLLLVFVFSCCERKDCSEIKEQRLQLEFEKAQLNNDIKSLERELRYAKAALTRAKGNWIPWGKEEKISELESKILELQQQIDDKTLELSVNSKKIKELKCPPFDSGNIFGIFIAIIVVAILGFIGYKKLLK
jgi:hypothetical protein